MRQWSTRHPYVTDIFVRQNEHTKWPVVYIVDEERIQIVLFYPNKYIILATIINGRKLYQNRESNLVSILPLPHCSEVTMNMQFHASVRKRENDIVKRNKKQEHHLTITLAYGQLLLISLSLETGVISLCNFNVLGRWSDHENVVFYFNLNSLFSATPTHNITWDKRK